MKTYFPRQPLVSGFLYMFGRDKKTSIIGFPNTPEMRKFHYPKKTGNRSWTIVDGTTGQTIDSYNGRSG